MTDSPASASRSAPAPSEQDIIDMLHAAASDLNHVANGGRCEPETLRAHAEALLAFAHARLPVLLAAERDAASLRLFAGKAIQAARVNEIGDWDGGEMQDAMVASGLLDEVTVHAPCGDSCRCAEYDDFPQTCYRVSALGCACLDSLAAASSTGSVPR